LSAVQEYVARHSDVIVIDPLESIMKLFDRHQQYNLVKHCLALDDSTGLCMQCVITTCRFCIVSSYSMQTLWVTPLRST